MKKTLKEDINDYYNAYHLSSRQLMHLKNLLILMIFPDLQKIL